ncbi:MAG: GFA family protein [Proteobacteria bacterium]|nr:GFA family protein [Pseudomonadota bacterium]
MGATRKAVCCCGACSIEVAGEPVLNAICHCTSCKKRTGSAFGWSVYFPDTAVVAKHGALNVYAKEGDAGYNRYFCAKCGTTLYWKSFAFLPDSTGVAGGCFVDDPIPEPNFSAQHNTHYPWLTLPADWLTAP